MLVLAVGADWPSQLGAGKLRSGSLLTQSWLNVQRSRVYRPNMTTNAQNNLSQFTQEAEKWENNASIHKLYFTAVQS